MSIVMSSGLLALWARAHPAVYDHVFQPAVADVAQAYALALVLISQAVNYLVIGPLTSKCVFAPRFCDRSLNMGSPGLCSSAINWRKRKERPTTILACVFSISGLQVSLIGCIYPLGQVSDAMKALNSRFGALHGVSSLANLSAVFALLFHGLWVGSVGTGI